MIYEFRTLMMWIPSNKLHCKPDTYHAKTAHFSILWPANYYNVSLQSCLPLNFVFYNDVSDTCLNLYYSDFSHSAVMPKPFSLGTQLKNSFTLPALCKSLWL